ncbi:ABC-type amino acid transport/signal transduction systems (fragment) [Candidatus Terasakiella magnetica]|uniref:ABC-type amino acid transport/signal transduction systems n=1 Tax=Candidatus Terasakiella magnetica TaxID=1867952 RepID=A0A1C3RKJ5_9PROT
MKLQPFALLLIGFVCFSLPAHAESLLIGIGLSKPPYVIQEHNAGAEYEIVERAIELSGFSMTPKYMPMKRIPHALNGGALDGGMNMRAHMPVDGFFSNEIISYQNYAITLKSSGLKISQIAELKNYSVVSFQNAHKLLGPDYQEAVKGNKQYSELANQELQVKMLAAGRKQVVISDFRIFLHFKKQVERETGRKIDVQFHEIFMPTPYRVAFRKRTVRDRFDESLEFLRKSGEYDQILAKYISADDVKAVNLTK